MQFSKNQDKVLITSHFYYYPFDNAGTSVNLVNFLLPQVKKIVHIEHPLPESPHPYSYLAIYEHGEKVLHKKIRNLTKPLIIKYVYDILLTQVFILMSFSKFNLAVAGENLSFISTWPFRKIGLIKKLIYYSVDYVPQRFQNNILNQIYHLIDRFSCQQADYNWVVSQEQIKMRKDYKVNSKLNKFSVVPIGYRDNEIKFLPMNKINTNQIIYSGGFRKITGSMLILDALPLIIKQHPKIKLLMIGGGPEEKSLKEKVRDLKIEKYVRFIKFIINHKKLTKILSSSAIGLAPYMPDPKSWSNFSDPSKIKLYLACGLPVITTRVTTMADIVDKNKVGLIIKYSPEELSKAIIFLISNKKRLDNYRKNALKFSKEYDVDKIFQKAISEV